MSLFKELWKVWQTNCAERKWKKEMERQFGKRPQLSNEMLDEKKTTTANGEPWVGILRMDVDPNNLSDGAIELDWNDIFIARLVKAGYTGKDDKAIVDQWFNNVCANIVAGTYENDFADPEKRKKMQRNEFYDKLN